jgi:hypothetical protein
MSILMKANENGGDKFVSVKDVVARHWAKYGRHFYCRYDYEGSYCGPVKDGSLRGMAVASYRLEISRVIAGVDSDAANSVMDLIRREFVTGGKTDSTKDIKLVKAEEFEYVHQ